MLWSHPEHEEASRRDAIRRKLQELDEKEAALLRGEHIKRSPPQSPIKASDRIWQPEIFTVSLLGMTDLFVCFGVHVCYARHAQLTAYRQLCYVCCVFVPPPCTRMDVIFVCVVWGHGQLCRGPKIRIHRQITNAQAWLQGPRATAERE